MVGLAPGQLVLECSVEAEPAPEIEWHRDGIKLQVGTHLGSQDCPAFVLTRRGAQALSPHLCSPSVLGIEGC